MIKLIPKNQTGGALTFKDSVNPFAAFSLNEPMAPRAPFIENQSVKGFFDSWISSPEYMSRLKNNNYSNPLSTAINRKNMLKKSEVDFYLPHARNQQSLARPATGEIRLSPKDASNYGIDTLLSHETAHVIGASPGEGTVSGQQWNPQTGFNRTEESIMQNSLVNPSKDLHDRKPEEVKADLDSNRYNMFKKGIFDIRKGEKFNQEHLNKSKLIMKDDVSFKRLIDQTGEDNYINLMNTIAKNKTKPDSYNV